MGVTQICFFSVLLFSAECNILGKLERSDVREIGARLEEEKAKRLLLQNDVEMLMLQQEKLERKCSPETISSKTAGNTIMDKGREVISFTARLSAQISLDLNHVIKFDQVLRNHGSGYSSSTGIFQPPVSGTYVFVLSLLSSGKGKHFHIKIMKNSEEIGRIFAGDTSSSWSDHGSVTTVTSLEVNDEVYTMEYSTSGQLHGDHHCTFSGFKL